jgi:nucleoside-diphosphate-sugar epimerase
VKAISSPVSVGLPRPCATKIVVTGAGGFIGRRLCAALVQYEKEFLPVSRSVGVSVGNIGARTDWAPVLSQGATVIHLAGLAHVIDRADSQDLAAFREVNVDGIRQLAIAASNVGVHRLIFISSIGVLGTHTNERSPFSVRDEASPSEAYGLSKWEAEQVLSEIGAETGLEVCVIRPPLVYGRGAAGNFGRLVKMVRTGLPIPLGSVMNRRSLVAVDNLVDLILRCIDHPAAAGNTFLVSDGHTVSTPELIQAIADAMGRRVRLWRVPVGVLRLAGSMIGKRTEIERLVGSLEVDISHTCETLDWNPPIDMAEGLRRAVSA